MLKLWLKLTLLFVLIIPLPIVAIRAQPYRDAVTPVLLLDDCPAPCLMGIRPGTTRMGRGIVLLGAHPWVVTDAIPTTIREAIFLDAAIPRIDLNWRWSAAVPAWINAAQHGNLTLEGREVLGMTIATRFTLGEIFLAFGAPDEARFVIANNDQFRYTAWYDHEGMLIMTRGPCPTHHYFHLPVQILYRADYPLLSEADHRLDACG
jgi:hypothetical protein